MAEAAPDFTQPNDRALDLLESAITGDVVAFGKELRGATEFDRSNIVVIMLAVAVLISAVGNLFRRVADPMKPFIEVAAEKWREKKEPPDA